MTTEGQQANCDSIHDLISESLESLRRVRYADISPIEKDKLLREVADNMMNIDMMR